MIDNLLKSIRIHNILCASTSMQRNAFEGLGVLANFFIFKNVYILKNTVSLTCWLFPCSSPSPISTITMEFLGFFWTGFGWRSAKSFIPFVSHSLMNSKQLFQEIFKLKHVYFFLAQFITRSTFSSHLVQHYPLAGLCCASPMSKICLRLLRSGFILKYDRKMEEDLSGMSNLCHGLLSAEIPE